jgi:hypothetical protein
MLWKKEMKSVFRTWPIIWVCIAVLLGYGSFTGGDTAIVTGWLFLLWTVPFGALWWFYGYDVALQFMPRNVAEVGGTIVVIIGAFIFWFVVVPWIKYKGHRLG